MVPRRSRWWIVIVLLGLAAIGAGIWYASGKSATAVPGASSAASPD